MLGWWTLERRLTWPQEVGKEESTDHLQCPSTVNAEEEV